MRATHTYATMDVSKATFEEIRSKLMAAGYDHAEQRNDGVVMLDMHGIALTKEAE